MFTCFCQEESDGVDKRNGMGAENSSAGNRRHFGPSIFLDVNILRSIEASISMYSTNNSSSRELVSGGPRSDTGLETVETTLH